MIDPFKAKVVYRLNPKSGTIVNIGELAAFTR
jgi:hypothetical protein